MSAVPIVIFIVTIVALFFFRRRNAEAVIIAMRGQEILAERVTTEYIENIIKSEQLTDRNQPKTDAGSEADIKEKMLRDARRASERRQPRRESSTARATAQTAAIRNYMQPVISLVMLGLASWVVISSNFTSQEKHWAYGTIGTIGGFWLKG